MKIKVKVVPNSSKAEIIELKENSFKIKVKAAPVKNMANIELIKIISKYFKVSESEVNIVKGLRKKSKVVEIDNNFKIL